MDFFLDLGRRRIGLDLVLVDGNHDYEFALFDLQMSARLLSPGGVIIMDNAEQSGPFNAARTFMASNPAWRELGGALAAYDPRRPFDIDRASMPGTSFVVLQSPGYIAVGPSPYSWGQLPGQSTIRALLVKLAGPATAGQLLYQVILRGFADGNRRVAELRSTGTIRLEADGPREILLPLAESLACDEGQAWETYTTEIELSWLADHGVPPLGLAGIPTIA
jgi:Methyltransferase domain